MSDLAEMQNLPIEDLVREYRKEQRNIEEAEKRREAILERIITAKDKQWDTITVQKAAKKSGLSIPTIYRFINSGRLKTVQHKGGRAMVSEKELLALDDKYGGAK